LGLIFSAAGLFWETLGQILSWPTYFLLNYIIKTIDFASKIPRATLTLKNVGWIWLAISYLILGLIIWRLQENRKLKFLKY